MSDLGREVARLVIAHQADDGLKYAVKATANVSLRLYDVKFILLEAPKPARKKK